MEGGEKPEDAPTVARVSRAESEPTSELEPGGSIGRYKLVSRLGAGAMGVVWCALDPQLDRKVAIKVVHGKLSRSSEASQRLLREARAMAKLSHRAVVTVHDAGETDGRLFLAMELVEGTTLGQMLRARTDEELRDWRKWLRLMLDAGRGLEAAHRSGILHRDFKPYNVLVDNAGRVCVADFGLATLGDDQVPGERVTKLRLDLTMTGAVLGTPAYMSPQQLRGEAIDARADQFSFCVATYEALYNQRPFEAHGVGWDAIDSLEAAIEARRILPPPRDSQVPAEVFEVLERGLAADPEKRWTSMSELLFALERARDGKRTDAHVAIPEPPPAAAPRWLLIALGAATLAVVGLIVMVLVHGAPTKPARVPKRLFDVPLKTKLAATPDGKRLLLATDRLEVRDPSGIEAPIIKLVSEDIGGISVTDREVFFGTRSGGLSRWRYATGGDIERMFDSPTSSWFGETVAGHVMYSGPGAPVQILDGGKVVRQWPVIHGASLIAVSPDRKRVAILDVDRFYGELVIRDVTRDTVIRSPRLENPTAIAWQDDATLVYATGAGIEPTLFRVRIVMDRLGEPEVLYRQDLGWFGELAVGGNRLFAIEMAPKSRARVVDLQTHSSNELDAATVGAALAWLDEDAYLIWNRTTKRVERRDGAAIELTPITLGGEPGNATVAGDILIVAVRVQTGRDIVAHSLATGEKLWSLAAPWTYAVRCADDRHAPCFALTRAADGYDQLRAIDPKTGEVGDKVITTGPIEDLAVSAAGDRIVLAMRNGPMRELTTEGTEVAQHPSELTTVRSVAFDRSGGLLAAGTVTRNVFKVGRVADGKLTVLVQSENDLLSLVRPSNDGQRVLVHARVYAPFLWEMPL